MDEEDELLYREMNEDDPWYMGDSDEYDGEDFDESSYDNEYSSEYEDCQEFATREDEILYYLGEGEYEVDPYIAYGVLYNNFHLQPGFNRVKLQWSLLESPKDIAIVNVRVLVDGEDFEYKSDKAVWKSDRKNVLTERITRWLAENIYVDYSDEHKIFKMHIPNAETAEDYLIDSDTEYFDIDGKLYQYAAEDTVFGDYTEQKRVEDSVLMKTVRKLSNGEAAQRIVDGDFEMLPPKLPKRRTKKRK